MDKDKMIISSSGDLNKSKDGVTKYIEKETK